MSDSAAAGGDLRHLWATEQIKQLKARYFDAVDDKDYEAIAEIFTEDAVVDFTGETAHHVGHHGVTEADLAGPLEPVIGGRAAADGIRAAIDAVVSVHQGHDPQIQITGDSSAKGRWSMYDILDYGHESMHGYGTYLEDYVLVNGAWRIARLTLTRRRVRWEQHPPERL